MSASQVGTLPYGDSQRNSRAREKDFLIRAKALYGGIGATKKVFSIGEGFCFISFLKKERISKKMKNSKFLSLLLVVSMLVCLASCSLFKNDEKEELTATEMLWESATYKEDVTLGEGSKTVFVSVIALEKTVKITVKTDRDNLGDALVDTGVAEGEMGAYGLYIKKVNGISADYTKDKAYWSFSIGGEVMPYGVSDAEISGGESYELVYTK